MASPETSSDFSKFFGSLLTQGDIARYVRQILAEDEYHRMKPTEVAKEVVAIITGSPTRKKRRPSSKAPASKNICDYISNT